MKIRCFATPNDLLPGDLDGAAAIVIDTLRMTSVAAAAMSNGCAGLLACATVEAAREAAKARDALLGGERNALRIDGFDFSNSPLEYTREAIGGKRLVMTTTNGTRAIAACAPARRLLLAALVNIGAVAEACKKEASVAIVCAGTAGAFTLEDALTAGALSICLNGDEKDDAAVAFETLWLTARDDLPRALSATRHYNRLLSLGFQPDLDFCLTPNRLSAVCERAEDGWFYRI